MNNSVAIHPGIIFKEDILDYNKLTVTEAAKLLNTTRINLSNIINKKTAISPIMALRISAVFGGSEEFWLKLQMIYDLAVAREYFKMQKIELPKFNIR